MLNKIIVHGRLTKDPELRRTPSGKVVANFSVACERNYTSNGEKKTDFFNCYAWEKTGEFVYNYFHKGAQILVVGSLELREYTDKNGNARTTPEINATETFFCGSKKDNANSYETTSTAAAHKPVDVSFDNLDDNDDGLPF